MAINDEPTSHELIDQIRLHERKLFDSLPCGLMYTLPTGEIIRSNTILRRWLGYTGPELQQQKLLDLISGGGRIFYETHYSPLLRMQGTVREINFNLKRKDQQDVPVLLTAQQHKDEQGNPLFNSVIVINHTERRKYEKELLEARKRAEASDQAKSLFLSTISHEVLTPLNAIISSADQLKQTPLDAQQRELQRIVSFSAESLLHLFDDMLQITKSEFKELVLRPITFSLTDLCHNLQLGLRYKAAHKDVQLLLDLDPDLPAWLIGDVSKLGQVLSNLLGNAIKFTQKGSVTLQTRLLDRSDERVTLRLAVIDTGIGIDQQKLEKIFKPFTQADMTTFGEYGGSGLGLAISQRIVQAFGSKIEVESQPGQGSVFQFTLTLPLGTLPVTEQGDQMDLRASARMQVLLVDDNETNRFLTARYLDQWNVAYDMARNGEEAVAKNAGKSYDVILMDLHMPVMDGYTAIEVIRHSEQHQPRIVAFSASTDERLSQRWTPADRIDFLRKPFRAEQLWEAIVGNQPAVAEAPVHEPSTELANAVFSPSRLLATFDNDIAALQAFAAVMLIDLQESSDMLIEGLQTNAYDMFAEAKHKLHTALELLQARQLYELLISIKANFSTLSEPDRTQLSQQLVAQFHSYISGLQNWMDEAKNQ